MGWIEKIDDKLTVICIWVTEYNVMQPVVNGGKKLTIVELYSGRGVFPSPYCFCTQRFIRRPMLCTKWPPKSFALFALPTRLASVLTRSSLRRFRTCLQESCCCLRNAYSQPNLAFHASCWKETASSFFQKLQANLKIVIICSCKDLKSLEIANVTTSPCAT